MFYRLLNKYEGDIGQDSIQVKARSDEVINLYDILKTFLFLIRFEESLNLTKSLNFFKCTLTRNCVRENISNFETYSSERLPYSQLILIQKGWLLWSKMHSQTLFLLFTCCYLEIYGHRFPWLVTADRIWRFSMTCLLLRKSSLNFQELSPYLEARLI